MTIPDLPGEAGPGPDNLSPAREPAPEPATHQGELELLTPPAWVEGAEPDAERAAGSASKTNGDAAAIPATAAPEMAEPGTPEPGPAPNGGPAESGAKPPAGDPATGAGTADPDAGRTRGWI